MPGKKKAEQRKPGPEAESLKISGDAGEVLDRLLDIDRDDETGEARPRKPEPDDEPTG